MDALDLFFSPAPGCLWKMQLFALLRACSVRQQARANKQVSKICAIEARFLDAIVVGVKDLFVCNTCLGFPKATDRDNKARWMTNEL